MRIHARLEEVMCSGSFPFDISRCISFLSLSKCDYLFKRPHQFIIGFEYMILAIFWVARARFSVVFGIKLPVYAFFSVCAKLRMSLFELFLHL
jgi:hypothetical protein